MQYWLKSHWPGCAESIMDDKDSPVFMHTTVFLIQQSWIIFVIICAHVCKWRNGVTNEAIVLQWPVWTASVWTASWDFKVVKKWWAGAMLSVKCIWRRRKEEKYFGRLATFWFGTFAMVFRATRCLVCHEALENEWYIVRKQGCSHEIWSGMVAVGGDAAEGSGLEVEKKNFTFIIQLSGWALTTPSHFQYYM